MKNIFELTETDKTIDEYQAIKRQIVELEKQSQNLQKATNYEIKELEFKIKGLDSRLSSIPKFSFLTKIIKRKKYLSSKTSFFKLESLKDELIESIQKLKKHQKIQLQILQQKIINLSKRLNEISYISETPIDYEMKQVIRNLKKNITYDKNGVPIIDDSLPEKFIEKFVNLDFDVEKFSLDDIVLVHTTNYFPKNHVINTSRAARAASAVIHRNTIHFALNGLVSDHIYGTFSNRNIVIIEPIKYHIDAIHAMRPEDTWVKGNLKLSTDAIILVREEEYNKLSQEILSEYNIIKFNGNEKRVVEKILLILGYKPQGILMRSWVNSKNDEIIREYFQKKYQKKSQGSHAASLEGRMEDNLAIRDNLLSHIRGEKTYTSDGINISYEELTQIINHFPMDDMMEIIQKTGIRVKNNGFYLLDDESIEKSYESGIDLETVKEVERVIKLHEEMLPYLELRKKILFSLLRKRFDTTNNIPITIDMAIKMYKCRSIDYGSKIVGLKYSSVRDFLNKSGIRKLDESNYQILSDSEIIQQYDKIDDEFCKEFEKLIMSDKSRSWTLWEEVVEDYEIMFKK